MFQPCRPFVGAGSLAGLLAALLCTGQAAIPDPATVSNVPPTVAASETAEPVSEEPQHGRPPGLAAAFDSAPGIGTAKEFLKVPPAQGFAADTEWKQRIIMARTQREGGSFNLAFANLHAVLDATVEEALKKEALLELAFTQHVAKQYPEAIKSYGIFLRRYPEDPGLPEVLLRQGLLYRDIGSPTTAIAKFHAVMSTALNLNLDEFNYYRRIVLLAQTQIADTLYQDGKLDQAAEKFEVLLREETDLLERTPVQYRLILSLRGLERHAEVIARARDLITRDPDAPEAPHVRYLLSLSLKELGRNAEALAQVMELLQTAVKRDSDVWKSWRQRTGNEIANRLYLDGDYSRALELYLNLVGLDTSPEWQFPVWYQIGLIHERLLSPQQAVAAYQNIVAREGELGPDAGPSARTLVDMARWRRDFIQWKFEAEKSKVMLQQLPATDPTPASP